MPVKMRYTDDWRKFRACNICSRIIISKLFLTALAEILSVKQTLSGDSMYYIHYIDFNKRLDEWVSQDRLDLKEMQLPRKEVKTPIKNGSRPCSPDRDIPVRFY